MTRRTKKPKDSEIMMREMVMPHHTNPQNTIFGGTVMSWIDIAAAMCAEKHSEKSVVTVNVSDIDFISPIKIGYHACIRASINYVGKSSMVVGVSVHSFNPKSGERRKTTKAYLTFVALDDFGKPEIVPDLIPETDEEKRRYENAKIRVNALKRLEQELVK